MGTYTIVIEGHGINHNGTPKDADEMAKAFVSALRASGHTEVKGFFVYGPKLATSFVEQTMKRGFGFKMAEPLAPTCDHITTRHDKSGNWAETCPSAANSMLVEGQEVIAARCPNHPYTAGTDHSKLVWLTEEKNLAAPKPAVS